MRQSKATWWALAAIGVSSALAPFACADPDTSGGCQTPGDDGFCSSAGSAGSGGSSGASGVGGGGSGGAPLMGSAGGGMGGTGGAPPCTDDADGDASCASGQGGGSLCVAGACTKGSAACDAKALVVVAHGRTVDDPALENACHYRTLDGARAALGQAAERLAVYADSASSTAPLQFAKAATLDGHHADATTAVALTLPQAAGVPLVAFAQGGSLRGVALNGGGVAPAVRSEAGALAVAGPTTLTNASPALELAGSAAASVTGTASAPVRLTDNVRGVVVPTDATLVMQGDDGAESLVVEGTTGGAAVFLDAATTAGACSTLGKVTLRGNKGVSGPNGTGALEVRRGRQVVVDGCTFVDNRQSVTLSGSGGSGGSGPSDFLGVQLSNNVFTDALPTEAGTGAVLCGDNLGATGTTLNLRGGNQFPGGQTCDQLPANSSFNCNLGQAFAHSAPNMDLSRQCVGGSAQCGGGT